jgi:hypothetical protein
MNTLKPKLIYVDVRSSATLVFSLRLLIAFLFFFLVIIFGLLHLRYQVDRFQISVQPVMQRHVVVVVIRFRFLLLLLIVICCHYRGFVQKNSTTASHLKPALSIRKSRHRNAVKVTARPNTPCFFLLKALLFCI